MHPSGEFRREEVPYCPSPYRNTYGARGRHYLLWECVMGGRPFPNTSSIEEGVGGENPTLPLCGDWRGDPHWELGGDLIGLPENQEVTLYELIGLPTGKKGMTPWEPAG
ncbi:hypothetical protein DR999_PMT17241 [Platysternon megacephalum]|uniref:Uncharacterized protein n=1 Tax=Platysternon megacephalum TaxID=55544 RepID=A0A4D9DV36_9SAUR|nr:hypothetical protein DR999_PMT17241 [Platysternon megacephalum]